VHNQRGALVLANGRVYVAFGGRHGDCGRYHGWVVGLPASDEGPVVSFRVPTARQAGIWAPAGPVVDRRCELLVATGPTPAFRVAWRSARFNAGPPIVAGGAVWTLDQETATLLAFDPATGHERGRVHVGLAAHFAAPSAAGGLVLLAVGRQVTAVTTR
jgi:hypothetical protein